MILTNLNGGRVNASGESAEALKRNGWREVAPEKEATPSPEPTSVENEKPAPKRTRRSTKK